MEENSKNTPDRPAELIELYALGMLTPEETAEFEAQLMAGNINAEALDENLRAVTALAEEMASVMPAPRRAVKDAIMAAIAPAEQKQPEEQKQTFVFANEGEWQEMVPGISMKVLHHDADMNRTTVLVRLAPGAVYPSHRHRGLEECLVLEGDLHVDGTILHAGDFTASYEEKVHMDTHSNEGCLLLISSPLDDEIL
jgi:anti-sigma factor ChrR (cupin superfamily)